MQVLWSPLVGRLGLEYSKNDDADTTQLRTLAVCSAANAGDAASVTIRFEICNLSLRRLFAVLFKLCLIASPNTSLVMPLASRPTSWASRSAWLALLIVPQPPEMLTSYP
jgi:hypothetical protein